MEHFQLDSLTMDNFQDVYLVSEQFHKQIYLEEHGNHVLFVQCDTVQLPVEQMLIKNSYIESNTL